MKLERLELRRIAIDLVTPFRTSFGVETNRDILLLHVTTDEGEGWGECVASHEPAYSSEFVEGSALVIRDHLWPTVVMAGIRSASDVEPALARFKGHQMAKAALEMALLDSELRANNVSWKRELGSTRDRIPSGVSVGIFDTLDELSRQVAGYIADGYVRIKLKIEPGWDIEPVRMIRDQIGPDVPLQVDANTAYTREDIAHLCKLDEFDLLLIEQPLPEEDILGHAELARAVNDASVPRRVDRLDADGRRRDRTRRRRDHQHQARAGGRLPDRSAHPRPVRGARCSGVVRRHGRDRHRPRRQCRAGVPPGFTLPGDISASTRFYARDIVVDPITVEDGHVTVPTSPGLGFELDREFLNSITTSTVELAP